MKNSTQKTEEFYVTLQAILNSINSQRENEYINLSGNLVDLSRKECVQVAQALATCPNLTYLDLDSYDLGRLAGHAPQFA